MSFNEDRASDGRTNILKALDRGDVAAIAKWDLSAAFDTVDHSIP